mmetsp:Transcript_9402/g.22291  ORF Transcript_9402/g.22291 Transcript_9402/m.22291 type:complete len:208 (+) Transcript_9402:89-712(+)
MSFFSSKPNLEDELFNMKFSAKQLARESKKAEKEMEKEKEKVKKAMQAGKTEIAQIHASNAIMHKSTAINMLKMSSRVDAVAAKLGAAVKMQKVTASMGQVTKTMGKVLKTMDLGKIQLTMDKFEKAFEDTDVMASTVMGTMEGSTSMSTPQSEIELLMQQVADENQLDISGALPQAATALPARAEAVEEQEEDALAQRLAQLKAPS